MFIVYILHSNSLNKFYIGYTGDSIDSRLRKHNSNHKGFTGRAKDWCVVYTETFKSKEEARAREKQIKGWKSRIMIKQLFEKSSD